MPYASVDIHGIVPEPPRAGGRPLIVHAPSDPGIKGTQQILAALERLRDRFDFDVEVVTGVSHEAAMAAYRRADIGIDQIHAGWYGGFAVELMAMGKPVASYIRGQDMPFVPRDMVAALPIYRIAPETLESDLAALLADRASWRMRGLASRRFVEAWHDPLRIAAQLSLIYEPRGLPAAARQAGQGA
jgi:glycosyltransferase involved in cell wall biosynthesis